MSAVISQCGQYRYLLRRETRHPDRDGNNVVVFIGVNPSTADATADDATVRKWRGFSTRWGYTHFVVGNLFAYRSKDVRALATAPDPVGPACDDYLAAMLREADTVVPCWGDRAKLPRSLHPRIDRVCDLIAASMAPVHVLGVTKGGDPKHPLMLGYNTPLTEWNLGGRASLREATS